MKNRLLLLLSLFGLVVPVSAVTSSLSVCAEDGEESEETEEPLEYDETVEDDYYRVRTYKNITVASIEENFRAPSGCVLTLSPNHDALTRVKEDIRTAEMFASETKFNMIDIVVYRQIGDSVMYSESDVDWNVSIDDFESYVEGKLPSLVLYEIEEKIADVDISSRMEINLFSPSTDSGGIDQYRLVFDIDSYHVSKYELGDILHLDVSYYSSEGDVRTDIRADYDENMFNDKYGFKTDGRVEKDWDPGYYYEIYSIKYYDRDTNVVLDEDDAYDYTPGVEIYSIPKKPLTVFAVMTFKQNGTEYTFYSNEVTLCDPFQELLIDGYNNRESVGAGESHKLTLNENLDYDSVHSICVYMATEDDETTLINNAYDAPDCLDYEKGDISVYTEDEDITNFDTLSKDFFTFDFKMDKAGDYTLHGIITVMTDSFSYYNMNVSFTVSVTDTPTSYTPIDEALTLNKTGRIDCVAGGDSISLEADIAKDVLNGGDEPVFEWTMSRLNVVELSSDGNKTVVNAVGGGVVTVTVSCTTEVFGTISRSVVINVIDDIYSITTLKIPDEFHYSGRDLTVGLNIDKYSTLANFRPEWSVTNAAGEAVEFTDNGDCTMTIASPAKDDYTVTALYNGVELDSKTIEVRTINTDEFIKKNIIWIALVTIGFVGLMVFLKVVLDRKGSLVARINKTLKKFEAIDRNSANVVKELNKIRISILGDIDYARNLNMTALNEYEKTIRYLGKSMADIKDISKNKATMTPAQYDEAYDRLSKDLTKARNVAKEIDDAKAQSLSNSLKANENNIVHVEESSKDK